MHARDWPWSVEHDSLTFMHVRDWPWEVEHESLTLMHVRDWLREVEHESLTLMHVRDWPWEVERELGVHDVPHEVHGLRVLLLHQAVVVALVQVEDGGRLRADDGLRVAGQTQHHLQVTCCQSWQSTEVSTISRSLGEWVSQDNQ